MAIDYDSPTGRVRLLIPDTNESAFLLSDEQIAAFLAMARGTGTPLIKRAAASALETIASSEALVSKKLRDKDLATDGPAVAKELRDRAAKLREEADDDEDNDLADGGGLDIVDWVDPFARAWGPEGTELESC
ncbi:hypothetical protein [Actinomadura bangladeshensis]|uniref:Uncharacterized protein n=1 Tax=Actinomadura bangladeshensis TaxID=453573 RepID=A0A6L9QAR0_9ACTN|nr:hypothetical protein [Actinomadura bangladeshensis]NEA22579.1 hypothetical protein [Actinomadura bangladeshensis]